MVTSAVSTGTLSLILGEKWFQAAGYAFMIGIGALVLYVLSVYFIKFLLAPSQLYREHDDRIAALENLLKGLHGQECDMNGSEVLEYMAKHSGFETKREIESALATAAVKTLIRVEAMPLDIARWLPVPPKIFETHTFILEPESDELKARFGYNPKNAKMGGKICREKRWADVAYHVPMFLRAEIAFHWPPEESS